VVPARVVAWSLVAVSAALTVLDTVLVAVSTSLLSTDSVGIHGWPLVNAASLGSTVLGAVIVGSAPRHPIGWLLSFVGVTTCISLAAESYGVWVLEHGGHGSTSQGQVGAWVAAALGGQLALTCFTVVFLVIPTGSFLSPRWRWVMRAAVAGYLAQLLGLLAIGPHGFDRRGDPLDLRFPSRPVRTRQLVHHRPQRAHQADSRPRRVRRRPGQHQLDRQPRLRPGRRRQSAMVRPPPPARDQRVGAVRQRRPDEELEVPQLVATERERQEVLALDPDVGPVAERAGEPLEPLQGRRPVEEREARERRNPGRNDHPPMLAGARLAGP